MKTNELYHHGVLGQKWGVRRYQNSDGTRTAAGKRREQRDRISAENAKRKEDVKNRRTLSDAQLDKKINRLKKEKELRELTEKEIYPGRIATQNALNQIGTRVLTTALTGAALYAGKALITKEFNAKELGSAVFNGGAKKK